MNATWRVLWILPLLTLSSCLAQSSGVALRVTGVVTSSRDGSPIPRCIVTLSPATTQSATSGDEDSPAPGGGMRPGRPGGVPNNPDAGSPGRRGRRDAGPQTEDGTAITDSRGRFSLIVPHAGPWTLLGAARGFLAQRYQQHDRFSTALVLSTKTPELRVDLVLRPAASLTGFVLDQSGDAVRNAQVAVQRRQPPTFAGEPVRWLPAGFAQTDDRGHYELTGLADGDYRLAVTAHPWWANSFAGFARTSSSPSPDPSLDVVFPLTWYPGTPQESAADIVALQAGEDRQADFQLLAVPALHLSIPGSAETQADGQRAERGEVPQLVRQRIGGLPFAGGGGQVSSVGRDGTWDIGGLTPGTYQLRLPGVAGGSPRFVQVTLMQGSSPTLSMENATPAVPLAVAVDGGDALDLQAVLLTDVNTGQVFSDSSRTGGFPGGFRRGGRGPAADNEPHRRVLQVPPGEYFVSDTLATGYSLAGLTATGAQLGGRTLRIADGEPALTFHLQEGRTAVRGNAREAGEPGKADAGAMVLLVPASYGSAGSLAQVRREQTATDGSFLFDEVPPGPYLLVSLTDGWKVKWQDPETLARYLVSATPLNVPSTGGIDQPLTSVTP